MVIRNPFSSETVHQIQELIQPYLDGIKEKSNAKYDPDWKNNLSIKSLFSVIDYEVPKSNNNNLSKISVDKPAKKIEIQKMTNLCIQKLEEQNFFKPKEKKPIMLENLRSIFYKMELSQKETRILSSVFANLSKKKVD